MGFAVPCRSSASRLYLPLNSNCVANSVMKMIMMNHLLLINVQKVLPLVFALSISVNPALAWGLGDCPHSKTGSDKEVSTEKVEKSESSQDN